MANKFHNINLEVYGGENQNVMVQPSTTIADFKIRHNIQFQRLILIGMDLEDDRTMQSYGIRTGSTLVVGRRAYSQHSYDNSLYA